MKWLSEILLAMEIKKDNERASLSKSISFGHKQDNDVLVLVQLCKIKVWRQCKTIEMDRIIVHVKLEDIYADLARDVQTILMI